MHTVSLSLKRARECGVDVLEGAGLAGLADYVQAWARGQEFMVDTGTHVGARAGGAGPTSRITEFTQQRIAVRPPPARQCLVASRCR